MKRFHDSFALAALVLACTMSAVAQTPASDAKQFAKDGLSFSYPNGWTIEDTSNADAQQFNLGRTDSEVQIRVFVYRAHVNTPERVAEARKVLVDPYVSSTVRQFQQMGAKPEQAPATTDLGAIKSEGVKISATLDGDPGAAEIHWGVLGDRLVVLTIFGPDKALQKAAPVWDELRASIAVQEMPKPQPQASPKK